MRAEEVLEWVRDVTGARAAHLEEVIQTLWSGYGRVQRVRLEGAAMPTAVLKWVEPGETKHHPRGWSGRRGHERKLRSYAVELAFWTEQAARCDDVCRVPACLGARRLGHEGSADEFQFLLEDLDASGFSARRHRLTADALTPCLAWLAAFHATFLGPAPAGVWPVGTYWHLETRPDELRAVTDPRLREAASRFDEALNQATAQTLVHGDAKLANFCFSPDGTRVAAVDFQYVGGGVGIKDVAYLFSSCFDEDECERFAPGCLDTYFVLLRRELASRRPEVDAAAIEAAWRALYPVAWADFVRFLAGWAPSHGKLHRYSRGMLRAALASGE